MNADRLALIEGLRELAAIARGFGLGDLADELDAARAAYLEDVRTYEATVAQVTADVAAGRLTDAAMTAQMTAAALAWQTAAHAFDRVAERVTEAIDVAARDLPTTPPPTTRARSEHRRGYPTLDELEQERRQLARVGQAHGYDALARKGGPFAGQRTTIRRRYKSSPLGPPGAPIEGICETAAEHQHPEA